MKYKYIYPVSTPLGAVVKKNIAIANESMQKLIKEIVKDYKMSKHKAKTHYRKDEN